MGFSNDFIWGAATSSYQIEGAAAEDGKTPSVWDIFCKNPGVILDEQNGDNACMHYHTYKEDVRIMKELGLRAYRFSVTWPRVIPNGIGAINKKGLDFYDALVDELLHNGIEPWLTLFHWDYPYELYKRGGWLNSESPEWFAEYTRVIVERLSDRVKHWITLNEPQCFILMGHKDGTHAPGLKLGMHDIFTAIHNAMLAHGKSVQAIRTYAKQPCKIGYAPVGSICLPASESAKDIEAARKGMFTDSVQNLWSNDLWMDPVFLGMYSDDTMKRYADYMPKFGNDDLKIINQPIDFLGTNIYRGTKVCAGAGDSIQTIALENGYPRTAFNWVITPECLYWGTRFFYERYDKPIVITENGVSNTDWVFLDGKIHDVQRIDYLHRHLLQLKKAAKDGVEIKGYFQWSLMDNFEWAHGYNERFGLVHVDFATQKRTIKDSGYWYKQVIESNGDNL